MSSKDKAKAVFGFLVCSTAFTQRNVTSVGLVLIFFAVYIMAGGKITTRLPALHEAVAAKGGLLSGMRDNPNIPQEDPEARQEMLDLTAKESKSVLGINRSKDRVKRAEVVHKRGKLFTEEEADEALSEKVNKDDLVKGANFVNRREQWKLERSERKPTDSLSLIEERLKIRNR